jgi:tetratricopeptide (TPR) repeat protein
MKNIWSVSLGALALVVLLFSCVTQKKKGEETSKFKKNYHSFTNKYNYWFNADELYRLAVIKLEDSYKDNYSQVLEVYPYAAADPQAVRPDLDNIIAKASKGIVLHRPGRWTDDNYLLLGQAQFLKRDYETAESSFKFIKEEQDPRNKSKTKLKSASAKKKESKKKVAAKKKAAKKKAEAKKKAAAKKKAEAKKRAAAKKKNKGKKSTGPAPKDAPKDAAAPVAPEPTPDLTVVSNPYGEPLGRVHAYPHSMIWYGRTLTEREKYEEAEFHFRELWEERTFPKSLYDELAVAEAQLYIKQKQYDKAIAPLSKGLELTQNKKLRARLAFILAQLYDRAGQYEKAYAAYDKVLRSNPQYEMEFNARLQQTYAGWANGKLTSTEASKTLNRMLDDDKNLEYRDQIYYTLAEIALRDNQKKEGIALLRKSLAYNQNNGPQKAESYLKLADLYFEAEDFVQAKNYYDSTLNVLPATDPRFKRATDYASNLKDIARLIQTIAANDSIVRIFYMDAGERKDLAKVLKKQREAAAAAKTSNSKTSAPGTAKAPAPAAGQRTSTFYFYNDAFLKKGKKDFAKNYGDRKLEDNWRRKNRINTGSDDPATSDSTKAVAAEDAELKDIFGNIPKTEAELSVLHLATYEAMYQLGTLFRDRLENNQRCVGTLEDMQTRYPDTLRFEKEAWYYCYLAHTDLKNADRAQYYLSKLKGKYPNSAYAKALTDPNFLNATKERERELNRYYEETYALFQKGVYKDALARCEEAPKRYGSQNILVPKFALLSALCIGNLNGSDAYCKALGEVIARYPESAEATRAKEIARLLGCKGFEVDEKKKSETSPIDDAFTREDDKLHYFIVALKGDNVRLDDVKAAVSDYNRENHKLEQLRISNIFLGTDTNTPIIVIRKFDNKEQAMRYYTEVRSQKDFLGESSKKTYNKEFFAVTQENYRRILKNKTLDGYREFFDQNYLK